MDTGTYLLYAVEPISADEAQKYLYGDTVFEHVLIILIISNEDFRERLQKRLMDTPFVLIPDNLTVQAPDDKYPPGYLWPRSLEALVRQEFKIVPRDCSMVDPRAITLFMTRKKDDMMVLCKMLNSGMRPTDEVIAEAIRRGRQDYAVGWLGKRLSNKHVIDCVIEHLEDMNCLEGIEWLRSISGVK